MDAFRRLPMQPTPRKFSEAERDEILLRLVQSVRSNMASAVARDAELLALRGAILKFAEANGSDRKLFSESIDEMKKHFHQELLAYVENQNPWIASVLDERKKEEI